MKSLKSIAGNVLFEYEDNLTIRQAVELAVKNGVSLGGANLRYAYLVGANLNGADLRDAYLRGAYLWGVNLRGADLVGADLRGANLSDANLSGAYLRDAYLVGANLRGADLRDADFGGADLSGAYLWDANLSGADLRDANLWGANLSGADLRDADLSKSNLEPIKADLFKVLAAAPHEVAYLKQAILDGKIDGSVYEGDCVCLSGTLEKAVREHNGPRQDEYLDAVLAERNSSRPIERFFLAIRKGDTPNTNQVSKLVLEWVVEFEKEEFEN